MLLSLAFALALSSAPQKAETDPNTVAPAVIQPRKGWGGVVPSDQEITRQLNQLVVQQPDRVLCVPVTRAGSRLSKYDCRTLMAWYNLEDDRDIQALIAANTPDPSPVGGMLGPPFELVDAIKARYRLPSARARAEVRAQNRLRAARPAPTAATPRVSNP